MPPECGHALPDLRGCDRCRRGFAATFAARPWPGGRCVHELPVVTVCSSCGHAAEDRHVRGCGHPTADRDTCTRVTIGTTHQGCDRCPDHETAGGVVVESGAGGLGDALLGLCAVAQLQERHPGTPVEYRPGPSAVPFVELFGGYDRLAASPKVHSEEPTPGARQLNLGYRQEQAERYRVSRVARYARNIGSGGWTLPKLRDPEKVRAAGADLAGAVVLAPVSTDVMRNWPLAAWLDLERRLLAAGYRTAVAHSDAKPLARFRGEKLVGVSAERLAGVMLNAAVVVSNDSGPAHLAAVLGTPTVVLGGAIPLGKVFTPYPRVRVIQGPLDCSGCSGHPPAGTGCASYCASLHAITPERVAAAVDAAWLKDTLGRDATGGYRTLLTPDRLASIRDAVRATNHLPGDLAELGVFKGGSAKVISRYSGNAAPLHLFDTFAGIPETDADPGGHHVAGEFAAPLHEVLAYLSGCWVLPHAGRFPDTAPDKARYRFVHLDADTYQSTRDAIDYFAPRMVPGGVMLLDDFEWRACPGVARALYEAFPKDRVEKSAEYQARVRF